jgi:hypothetical protein
VSQKIQDEKAAASFAVAVLQLTYDGPLMMYRLLKELDMSYVNKSFGAQYLDLTLAVLQQN